MYLRQSDVGLLEPVRPDEGVDLLWLDVVQLLDRLLDLALVGLVGLGLGLGLGSGLGLGLGLGLELRVRVRVRVRVMVRVRVRVRGKVQLTDWDVVDAVIALAIHIIAPTLDIVVREHTEGGG